MKKTSFYLKNIILLCKLNNIKLTAFKAPEFNTFKESIINYDEIYNNINDLLYDWDIPYHQLNSEIDNNIENFYEGGHLRNQALIPFTELFAIEYVRYSSQEDKP
jgi:hypothetical protein